MDIEIETTPSLPAILAGITSINVQLTGSTTVSFKTELALVLRQLVAESERIPSEKQRIVALIQRRSEQYEALREAGMLYGPNALKLTALLEASSNGQELTTPAIQLTPLGDKLNAAAKELLAQASLSATAYADRHYGDVELVDEE